EGGARSKTDWYDSGIAFAIPLEDIAPRFETMRQGKDVQRGKLGIVMEAKVDLIANTKIAAVQPRSPAARIGIKPGDVLQSINGQRVRRPGEVKGILGRLDAGNKIELNIERDEQKILMKPVLVASIPPFEAQQLGITVTEIENEAPPADEDAADEDAADEDAADEEAADKSDETEGQDGDDESGAGQGSEESPNDADKDADKDAADDENDKAEIITVVVTTVYPGSPADGRLQVGDVIVSMNDSIIENASQLRSRALAIDPDTRTKIVVIRDEEEATIDLQTTNIAGPLVATIPAQDDAAVPSLVPPNTADGNAWAIEALKLPDESNQAAYLFPKRIEDPTPLGLLVVMLNPGNSKVQEALKGWKDVAVSGGIVVVAVAANDEARWLPTELPVAGRLLAAVEKQLPIDPLRIAVTGEGEGAGAAMAIAVGMTQKQKFRGVCAPPDSTPPALPIGQNDPTTPVQFLLPMDESSSPEGWAERLIQGGYPIIRGGKTKAEILRWIQTLQRI
ncbi:MAG: PDZ domain-containing protein, partial [Planctomycetota bacterium]